MDNNSTQEAVTSAIQQQVLRMHSEVLQLKGHLCDAQHNYEQAGAQVGAIQRELAMAQARLNGAQSLLDSTENKSEE